MSEYFSKYPIISYNGVSVRDITRRTNFIKSLLSNPYVFLPYTVKEGEKPEDIAYHYYGSVEATWIVLLCNNIIDPYYDWPLTQQQFDAYIIDKYTELSGKTNQEVLYWTQNETIVENILYYYRITEFGKTINVSPDTFLPIYNNSGILIGRNVDTGWMPYRFYSYEQDLNSNKREILVVEKQYYTQVTKEFRTLIST